jgi:hypothetical protein
MAGGAPPLDGPLVPPCPAPATTPPEVWVAEVATCSFFSSCSNTFLRRLAQSGRGGEAGRRFVSHRGVSLVYQAGGQADSGQATCEGKRNASGALAQC